MSNQRTQPTIARRRVVARIAACTPDALADAERAMKRYPRADWTAERVMLKAARAILVTSEVSTS